MFVRILIVVILLNIQFALCKKKCAFKCPENGACLEKSYYVCDGIKDCIYGSDESYVQCKEKIEIYYANLFYCANGVTVDIDRRCNGINDCGDNSDESLANCESDNNPDPFHEDKLKCGKDQLMCPMNTTRNCISMKNVCDGIVDCLNGRDESLELCMRDYQHGFFQCANGASLDDDTKVCDNIPDCLDGSDELDSVCEGVETWKPKPPVTCEQPIQNELKFINTTMYPHNATHFFVYANGAVQFECANPQKEIKGIQWNVCMNDGSWRNELPLCIIPNKNFNVNTNGTRGCRIDTFDLYKENLRILKCSGNNCENQEPPINNMTVKFHCLNGYELFPKSIRKKSFICQEKTWVSITEYNDPRCSKTCRSEELYCDDTMHPHCELKDKKQISCNLPDGLSPNTIVTFNCEKGYRSTRNMLKFECLNNGTWKINGNRKNYCTMECGNRTETPYALNSQSVQPDYSPWSVVIYLSNSSSNSFRSSQFKYQCGGILIRHNFLLTAAHCVVYFNEIHEMTIYEVDRFRVGPVTSNTSFVDKHYGWSVKGIKVNPSFYYAQYMSDTAIMHLMTNENIHFPIICVPGINFNPPLKYRVSGGFIFAWDTNDIISKQRLSLGIIEATVNENDSVTSDQFFIQLENGKTICKGDSGSGFIADCPYGEKLCLFGTVSTSRGSDGNCSSDIKIISAVHSSNVEFIKEYIDRLSYTCEEKSSN